MARHRPPSPVNPPVTEGAQTILGRLAEQFRLGQFGQTTFPQAAEPGRPQLSEPADIIAELTREGMLPTAQIGPRISERYICIVTDTTTGRVVARIPREVEYSPGTARSTRYSRARRSASKDLPRYLAGEDVDPTALSMSCQRIRGSEFTIPAQES